MIVADSSALIEYYRRGCSRSRAATSRACASPWRVGRDSNGSGQVLQFVVLDREPAVGDLTPADEGERVESVRTRLRWALRCVGSGILCLGSVVSPSGDGKWCMLPVYRGGAL